MIKLDDATLASLATPQRPLADHASRNWQAVLEREWLGAWPAPMPSVPQRENSNGAPQMSPEASAFLAGAESSTTAPPSTSASTSPPTTAATTSGTGHTAVPTAGGTVSGRRQVAATAMVPMTSPALPIPTEQSVWGTAVDAASLSARPSGNLPPSATTVGAGQIEPLSHASAPGLVIALGVALPQAECAALAEQPASAAHSAKAGLGNMPQWEGALRLASPEDGKVQAVLRDASLSQEGAHQVALNLTGTLASMGFEAIRIYVNGKQYGADKEPPQPTRSARAGSTTLQTVSLVSKVKE